MKRWILWVMTGVLMMPLSQCTTDFDITAPHKEVMFIYGLLNQNEPVQYIRIQRAYLDEEASALSFVDQPDSIYYPDILDVTITEVQTNQTYPLERVRIDTIQPPIVKDTGLFVNTPHYAYRFARPLNPNSTYRLRVENTQTGKVATAETRLVQDFQVIRPFQEQVANFLSPTPFLVFWNKSQNGQIHDLSLRLHWSIADPANPFVRIDTVSKAWPVFTSRDFFEASIRYEMSNDNFFVQVAKNITPNPAVIRYADSLSFQFYVGSPVLSDYINFSRTQTGITQDLAGLQYTNVEGENAYGIFASRYQKVITGIKINNQTRDSLACGYRTNNLQFAPSNDPARYPNYPYCN